MVCGIVALSLRAGMLAYDPAERLTAASALRSPVFTGMVPYESVQGRPEAAGALHPPQRRDLLGSEAKAALSPADGRMSAVQAQEQARGTTMPPQPPVTSPEAVGATARPPHSEHRPVPVGAAMHVWSYCRPCHMLTPESCVMASPKR